MAAVEFEKNLPTSHLKVKIKNFWGTKALKNIYFQYNTEIIFKLKFERLNILKVKKNYKCILFSSWFLDAFLWNNSIEKEEKIIFSNSIYCIIELITTVSFASIFKRCSFSLHFNRALRCSIYHHNRNSHPWFCSRTMGRNRKCRGWFGRSIWRNKGIAASCWCIGGSKRCIGSRGSCSQRLRGLHSLVLLLRGWKQKLVPTKQFLSETYYQCYHSHSRGICSKGNPQRTWSAPARGGKHHTEFSLQKEKQANILINFFL